MPRPCSICTDNPDREAIDAAAVGGASFRSIARRYGVGDGAVARHVHSGHVSPALVAVAEAKEADRERTTAERVEGLYRRVERLLDDAEHAPSATVLLAAVREMRGCLELLARLRGELKPDGPTVAVNLLASPDLHRLLAAIDLALAGHPEARAALAAQLGLLEAGTVAVPRLADSELDR